MEKVASNLTDKEKHILKKAEDDKRGAILLSILSSVLIIVTFIMNTMFKLDLFLILIIEWILSNVLLIYGIYKLKLTKNISEDVLTSNYLKIPILKLVSMDRKKYMSLEKIKIDWQTYMLDVSKLILVFLFTNILVIATVILKIL